MLTYRTGAAGAPGIADAMTRHLVTETQVKEVADILSKYYANYMAGPEGQTAALPSRDMAPEVAAALGIDPNRAMTMKEVRNVLTGLRADGKEIEGQQQQKASKNKGKVAYIDLTFSAPKSASVAIALAPTGAEAAIIDRCHVEAVDAVLKDIFKDIGQARRGKAGSKGTDEGSVASVRFEHFTARPTHKQAVEENGVTDTVIQTVKVAGDPQRHTHVIVPNVVVTEDGHVGSLHLQKIKDQVHEYGALYQAYYATNLRKHGVEVELDARTGMARLAAVPRWVDDLYSKRTHDGEEAARRYAERQGIDWERLSPQGRINLLKGGTKRARKFKGDDLADYAEWKRQADEVGYRHRSVLRPGEEKGLAPDSERLAAAYTASLPVLEPLLNAKSQFEGRDARVSAAKGLIASGIKSREDVDVITNAYRKLGVKQSGEQTSILWGQGGGRLWQQFTTEKHLKQEADAITLLQKTGADRSSALTTEQIGHAIGRFLASRPDIDPQDAHWIKQREMIVKLGAGGRTAVGIGVAGSGKTTLLQPLVDEWHRQGKTTYGVTLAWRQTHALADAGVGRARKRKLREPDPQRLTDAGIDRTKTYALASFVHGVEKGFVRPDKDSVVIIDEVAQIGTRQMLQLARLQERHGFQIVALGDDKQCMAIEAGATIDLLRRALGDDQIPEILSTIRQKTDRERETTSLFRKGKKDSAKEALERKDQDGTLHIVPGNYKDAVKAAVDLWEKLRAANAVDPEYTLGITVPTNNDTRQVGTEVRERLKGRGELGQDFVVLKKVTDQSDSGIEYDLPIAIGEKVRVFKRINNGTAGAFADNGSVVEITGIKDGGLTMRNQKGTEAHVRWDALRNEKTGRIMLSYGYAMTIDSRQGDTLTDSIFAMPEGSRAVDGFKSYSANSRHRVTSHIVTSHGAEKEEIEGRRPLGDIRNLETDPVALKAGVIENMARNLARHEKKVLASDWIEAANNIRRGMIGNMQAFFQRSEVRQQRGQAATAIPAAVVNRHNAIVAATVAQAVAQRQQAVRDTAVAIQTVPSHAPPQRPKKAAPTPSPKPKPKAMSETEIVSEFADALQRAGLQLKGPPIMDGKLRREPVGGDKNGAKSGTYVGHLDDPPSGYIHNFRTGEEIRWRASAPLKEMSAEEREARRQKIEAQRIAHDKERADKEQNAAANANRIWDKAVPAVQHGYLQTKEILPYHLRQDSNGKLIVPLRDVDGKLMNVQTISADGTKLFLKGGRKAGLFTVYGTIEDGKPFGIAEGVATGAIAHELTRLPVVVALDAGNLMPVSEALHGKYPNSQKVFFADNDHHLPKRMDLPPHARKNQGLEKAEKAAKVVGGVVLVPPTIESPKGTDWQDFTAEKGRPAAREQMRQGLRELGVAQQSRGKGLGR